MLRLGKLVEEIPMQGARRAETLVGEHSEEVEAAAEVHVVMGQDLAWPLEHQMALVTQLAGLDNESVRRLEVLEQGLEVERRVSACFGIAEAGKINGVSFLLRLGQHLSEGPRRVHVELQRATAKKVSRDGQSSGFLIAGM